MICDTFLNKTAEKAVPLLHLRDFWNADDWFSIWKGMGFILLIFVLYINKITSN